LVIDVDTWMTAHDYHRSHHQLHLLTLHGSGVASGLGLRPTDPPSDSLIVEPGVAIDAAGNVIIVPTRQRLAIESGDRTTFVTLDYVESLPTSVAVNGHEGRGRMVEDYRIRLAAEQPAPPALEIGRVRTKGASPTISAASQPLSPGANEIDLRFRPELYPQAATELSVTLVVVGAEDALDPRHLGGLYNLLRELRRFGVRPLLSTASGSDIPAADLLYVTAAGDSAIDAKTVAAIAAQLKRGTWLFVDACGPGVAFVEGLKSFGGGKRSCSETEAKVLNVAYTFGSAPSGASTTHEFSWGPKAIISPRDFGCAWAAGRADQPLQRDQIRSALEFGVNVALSATGARAE
jgi:hypothetical protein